MTARPSRWLVAFLVHASSACVVGAVLVAAGQPIFTDDLWWHLGMGGHYAAAGPWLDADPFLFGAERPAEAAAWITDLAFHGVHRPTELPCLVQLLEQLSRNRK